MSFLTSLVDVILNLNTYLDTITQNYGIWTYGIIFLIIFCETGLVITPFLPGDSIIFAAGTLAALGSLNIFYLFIVFYIAAVVGDTVNYHIGKKVGGAILEKENVRFINKEYLHKANKFYKKHGSMTIVIARFIPIIRTFAPFVAGVGEMTYSKFITYNLIGGFVWVVLFLGGGFAFGNLPFIKNNFSFVVIAIIIISLIPGIVMFIREKKGISSDIADIPSKEIQL